MGTIEKISSCSLAEANFGIAPFRRYHWGFNAFKYRYDGETSPNTSLLGTTRIAKPCNPTNNQSESTNVVATIVSVIHPNVHSAESCRTRWQRQCYPRSLRIGMVVVKAIEAMNPLYAGCNFNAYRRFQLFLHRTMNRSSFASMCGTGHFTKFCWYTSFWTGKRESLNSCKLDSVWTAIIDNKGELSRQSYLEEEIEAGQGSSSWPHQTLFPLFNPSIGHFKISA
jgi:hypothetical protein